MLPGIVLEDDEPVPSLPAERNRTPSPPGGGHVQPGSARPVTEGPALLAVDAPLPPIRPFDLAPDGGRAVAGTSAPPVASFVTAPPPSPPVETARDHPPPEPFVELSPDMRVAFAAPVGVPSSTEEIEQEEARAPEPPIAERQTDAVDVACIRSEVLAYVQKAGAHFGVTPIITSGQRDRGRRGSFHRRCMAVDFFVPGIERARLARFLRSLPGAGGVGTYCHTRAVHIDIGEPRNWYQCGRRFRFAQR